MVDVNADSFSPATFHCRSPRKLKLSKLDPSCCIGFYCATRADFERFVATVQTYLLPVRVSPTPPAAQPLMSASLNGCLSAATASMTGSVTSTASTTASTAAAAAYPMFVFSRARSSEQQVASTSSSYREDGGGGGSAPVSPGDEAAALEADDDGDETEEFVML